VVVLGLCLAVPAQRKSFPGATNHTRSPNGRYEIQNVDNQRMEPAHTLLLIDLRSTNRRVLYKYGRHVDLSWSPASDALVINDYEGSNSAKPVLFDLVTGSVGIDLKGEFLRLSGPPEDVRRAVDNHHVYLTAEKWLDDREILCRLSGYGESNPQGFTKRYVYVMGSGFRKP